eukprot:7289026-Prymnesium_polylepis.2
MGVLSSAAAAAAVSCALDEARDGAMLRMGVLTSGAAAVAGAGAAPAASVAAASTVGSKLILPRLGSSGSAVAATPDV